MQESANFYEFYLKNTTEGQQALKYLYKRKLNDEIIKRFRIGLAPKEADLLYKNLHNEKFQPLDMIEAGVVRSSKSYYDVFRNRIIFPIEDIDGHIVGFSGRIYQDKKTDESKYMNSSENIIFKKGNILYNYKSANNEIRLKDQVFVFEGFMDVIAAYRAKVYNTIATMGTSLTPAQIKAIGKITKNVVLCYDGDTAGIEAAKKAIRLFTDAKFNVKAVIMPVGLDPDEYINQHGEEKLYDFLNNQAVSGIDYLYEVEKNDLKISDINSVESFKNKVFQYLRYFHSSVINEKYLEKLSQDINVSVKSLTEDFGNQPIPKLVDIYDEYPLDNLDPIDIPIIESYRRQEKKKYINAERHLIKVIYRNKEKCKNAHDQLGVKYVDPTNRNILFNLYDYFNKNDEMIEDKFQVLLEPIELEILKGILASNSFGDYIEINDLVKTICEYRNEKDREEMATSNFGKFDVDSLTKYAKLKNKITSHKTKK